MRIESGSGCLLLLTKFNAVLPGRSDRAGLEPAWLAHRLQLFCDWTLPSVLSQQRRPDRWLIFVDADTPATSALALANRVAGLGELVPVAGPLTDAAIGELVAGRLAGQTGPLVSVRLDSDDAIAASYLARVSAAAGGWRGFVNAPLGYRLAKAGLVGCRDRSGPFLSFVEDWTRAAPRTVFQVPHAEAPSRAPVLQLGGPRAWLQVIHDRNLANRLAGWPADRDAACAAMELPWLRERLGARTGLVTLGQAASRELRHELAWRLSRVGAARVGRTSG
ncbi:MAG: glycosyltransferase [Amaricoccus sp.]